MVVFRMPYILPYVHLGLRVRGAWRRTGPATPWPGPSAATVRARIPPHGRSLVRQMAPSGSRKTRGSTGRARSSTATRRLDEYDRKRDFERTPEPAGESASPPDAAPRFVIQQHDATR